MTVAAVILAAGSGSRFDSEIPKLRAPLGGSSVVGEAVAHAQDAGLDETIVVVGAIEIDDLLPDGVTVVRNESWEQGLASSLRVACAVAGDHGHDAVVVGLGDQPFLEPGAWRAVADSGAPVGVATYDGGRGHPVRLSAETWPLLPVSGEEGARALIRLRPELVREVACEGRVADIDTLEDLERWS